jgi:hypothetical protein
MREHGTFAFANDAAGSREIDAILKPRDPRRSARNETRNP